MNDPWIMLTKTYLRRALPGAISGVFAAVLLPWQFGRMLGLTEDWSKTEFNPMGLYFNFVAFTSLLTATLAWVPLPALLKGTNFKTLPLSTRSLGTFLWLVPACTVLSCSLCLLFSYRLVFETNWPIITTAVCMMACSMLATSFGYWSQFRLKRISLAAAVIAAWCMWFVSRFHPSGFGNPIVTWTRLSPLDMGILLVTLAGTWRLQVAAFANSRCAEVNTPWLAQLNEQEVYAASSNEMEIALPKYDSSFAGLLAMEWTKGRSIAKCSGVVLSVFTLLFLGSALASREDASRGVLIILPTFAGTAGLLIGVWITVEWAWSQKQPMMKSFTATLPFSDAALSQALLRSILKSVTVVGLMILVSLLFPVLIYSTFFNRLDLSTAFTMVFHLKGVGPFAGLLLIPFALCVGWITSGLTASVAATGRMWVGIVAYMLPSGITISLIFLSQFAGPIGESIGDVLQAVTAVLIAVASCACFTIARRRGFILNRTLAMCGGITILLMLIIGYAATGNPYNQFLACCVAPLAVLPIASLPLAVSWNRHR